MTFYEAMQLGANSLKPMIKDTKDKKLRRKYISAFIIKDFLCILFCMLIVVSFSRIFGVDNSIVGVVTVVLLLTFRFSNLDFNVKQSAITLFGIFMIYAISPYIASISNPIIGSIINFVSIMAIIILSCHNVQLSNQSTLVLSYLLLYGYEVNDFKGYINRVFGLILGGIIVAGIFYYKQRKNTVENTFSTIIKDISLSDNRTKWQIKLALGICSAVLIGELLNLPRTIWIGFACMSILQPTPAKLEFRYKARQVYVVLGCIIFSIVYLVLPEEFRGYVGIIGGLMVGVSATYEWQTVFNCFGALIAAIPILGLGGAVIMRIINTIFGAVYTKIFDKIFDKVYEMIFHDTIVDEVV